MNALFTKQSAAVVALLSALGNVAVAFGLANATLAAVAQGALSGTASLVLYLLHRKDKADAAA